MPSKSSAVEKYQYPEKKYAEMYGCDVRTIRRYKKAGYPLDDPEQMAEVLAAQHKAPAGSGAANINAAKLKKLKLECERLAFKNKVERGLYTLNTKVTEDGYSIGAAVGAGLDKLRADLPSLLLGLDEARMAEVIETETTRIRAQLADKMSKLYGVVA